VTSSLRKEAMLLLLAPTFALPLGAQTITLTDRMFFQARVTVGVRSDTRGTTDSATRFVAAREAMLRFCYSERGLLRDTTLAGFLFVRLKITSTSRTDSLTLRTDSGAAWSAPAGKSVRACVADKVRTWYWPPSTRNAVYDFVFGFVRDRDAPVKLPLSRG
jgi:hypothetical protein